MILWKEGRNQLAGPLVELLLITAPKVKPRHVTRLNVITLWACLGKTLHWEQTASQGSTCSQFRRKKDIFLLSNEQKHLDPGDPELIYIPQKVFHNCNEEGIDDSKSSWPKAGCPTHEPLPRQEPWGRSGEKERDLHTSPVMIIPGVRSLLAAKSSSDEFQDQVSTRNNKASAALDRWTNDVWRQ